MKTRLLGAVVLLALLVLVVPMLFSSKPSAVGGDQAVSLAIPPAPDGDLQTKTMSLAPGSAASSVAPPVATAPSTTPSASGQLATVDINSNRPHDVGTDAAAPQPASPTVTTGSGSAPTQPVIPVQGEPSQSSPPPRVPVVRTPAIAATPSPKPMRNIAQVQQPAPAPAAPVAPTAPAVSGHGNYRLNLSAYASATGAQNLARRVRALGYPVSSRTLVQAGQPRTQVIAGPFETRTAAEAARLKITQSISSVPATVEQDSRQDNPAAAVAADVAAAAPSSAAAGSWAVQLAAMSNPGDANALRDKLRASGFDGFVDTVQAGGRQLWRVRAGPQTQRADAMRLRDQIKAKLGLEGNVVSAR